MVVVGGGDCKAIEIEHTAHKQLEQTGEIDKIDIWGGRFYCFVITVLFIFKRIINVLEFFSHIDLAFFKIQMGLFESTFNFSPGQRTPILFYLKFFFFY